MIKKLKIAIAGMLFFLPFLSNHAAFGQTTGDYRSVNPGGAWNSLTTWERFNGVTWVTPTALQGVPGALVLGSNVTIQNNHTVNANVGTTLNLGNITLLGSGIINFNTNTVTITASGTLTMDGTSQISGTGTNRILSVGALNVPASATNANLSVQTFSVTGTSTIAGNLTIGSDTGVKTFTGSVTNSGSWTSTAITTTGNLIFKGGITNSGTFSAGGATFNTNAQSLGGSAAMSFANIVTITTITLTNNNTATVTFSNTGAGVLAGTGAFAQGTNSSIAYAGSTITVTTFTATATGNTVNYTSANPTILSTSYYHLTYSGASTPTVTSANIAGDLTVSSGGSFSPSGTIVFNGNAATQNINGAGTISFTGVTLNTGTTSVNVNNNISISGTLTFSSAKRLVVNSSSNITLGSGASISGAASDRYIQLDGSTGANSNLIKTSAGTTASWAITYPIGTSNGGYTPLTLTTVNTNPTNGALISVKAIYNNSNQGQLRRVFRTIVTGNATATTFTNASFAYVTASDVSSGDAIGNYSTIWFLTSTGGSWTSVTGTNTGTSPFTITTSTSLGNATNYYTIGTSTAYPNTWYSYQTGVWSNWQNWTLDPSGSTLNNGLNLPPQPGDAIVILNGITITNDVSGQIASSTTINSGAILDMSTTTGNTLGTVSGAGTLRVSGTNLPTGAYTSFVTASTGGTVEYYNISGTLPTSQTTYNNLKFSNSTSSAITFVEASNLTVNGTFNITATSTGTVTWQINDNTNNQRTINVLGDLVVSANGLITAGTGNSGSSSQHSLTLNGNFTNSGTVQFFDPTDATYSLANYTSGAVYTSSLRGNAVNVTFSGISNNTLTCSGQTDFYRLILNKGTGQQAILSVNSSNTSYFRLFAPTNLGSSGTAPNSFSNNSLSIVNGTLKLSGSIAIGSMTEGGGSFPIPQNGALWMNGSNVTIQVTSNNVGGGGNSRMIIDYGLLRITDGTLNMGYSRGLLGGQSGQFIIEGGTVNTWQFRTTNLGSGNNFSYTQSGGTVNVGTSGLSGETVDGYARFSLPYTTSTFTMSNGTLNIASPITGTTTTNGGIAINANSSNISVTGGTVNCYIPTDGSNFGIASNASFYNLNILDQGGTGSVSLSNVAINDGVTSFTVTASALQVINNLTIVTGNTPILNCNGLNLSVGGNFDVQASTTFTPGSNIVTFNGSGSQTWTNSGTITSLNSVVVNKSAGTLTLSGSTLPNVPTLTLTSGTFADGGQTVTVTTTLTNNATHTSSGSGNITFSGTNAIAGANGTFGNLTVSTNATVSTSGDQTITGTLRLTSVNSSLNIASYALTVLGNIYSDGATGVAFSSTKRVLTSGLHNAGGLTRQSISGDLLFPVGSSAVGANAAVQYSPITINTTATTQGKITVRPVNSEHPNVTTTSASLVYYWRVTSSGFTGISAVTHKSYTFSTATKNGTTTSYRLARYNRTANSWATSNTNYNQSSTVMPDFNTGTGWTGVTGDQLDGEYTCGNIGAFGTITTYYSRQSGNWNSNSTWSTISVGGAAASSNPTSCATCPVIIGDGASNNHVITTVAASSCGSLTISAGSTLDCSTFTGHNFGTSTGGTVTGTGTLRIAAAGGPAANMFPAGDFTNFLGSNGGTVEWYGATKTIPTTGPSPQNLSLMSYYNLVVNPSSGNVITLPSTNLAIYKDLTVGNTAGFNGTVVTNGSQSISIIGDLNITRGSFVFSNANPSVTALTVNGNTTIDNGASMIASGGGAANVNTLSTPGSITNNGTLNFRNISLVNIIFTGPNDATFGGSGNTTLNLVTINKGSSQTPTVTCSLSGTLNTTAVSGGWLTLTNGTFDFEYTGSSTPITLSTTSFSIPATTKLKVGAGNVRITSTSGGTNDLFLTGSIEVGASGTLYTNTSTATGSDNDVEYAAAGTPSIVVSGGTFVVDGQIRRSTATLSGALVYNQSAGSVTIGGNNPSNIRGIFEIDSNSGSSFTMSGTSTLTVQRPTNGTGSYRDLHLNPASGSVSSGTTINLGLSTGAANFTMNVAPTVGNFTFIASSSAYSTTMYSNNLNVGGTLTINSNATLITNSLNVLIAGNLAGTGTYNGSANTTTFNGSGAQSGALTSTSNFNNMTINNSGGATVTLSGTAPTLNNLNILSGVLDVGSLALNVNGDVTNNSSQVASGGGSITFTTSTTSSHTITSSNGSFTNLNLGGAGATNQVNVSGNMTMNGTLNFTTNGTSRYLNIGSNQLTFSSSATVSNAGSTRFIKTNGVSSDLGVVKNFAVGTSSFTFPFGTRTNYTPVSISSLVVTTAGSYNIIPVDDQHPTASATGEQILNYYWMVLKNSTLVHNATGTLACQVPTGLIGGAGGTLYGAYLDAINLIGWTQAGSIATGGGNTTLTFSGSLNTVMPAVNGEFDYTYGTSNTLPNPIQPVYSRFADANGVSNPTSVSNTSVGGSWATATNWTLSNTGNGAALSVVPSNRPVVILPGARINLDLLGQRAFTTTVNGLLVVTTVGHNLGSISGTGTMRTTTSTLPGGNYTTYTSSAGGTIEYVAPMTMNSRSTYNNLSIYSGSSGTVTMTATDLVLNGNLTIPSGTTLDNSVNNKNIGIAGNWSNSGTFTTGTGTVTFNGTGAQSITGTTSFNALTVNKSSNNLTLNNATVVNGALTLTSGKIISNTYPSTPLLQLGSTASISGGSSSSFVDGQIRAVISNGNSLTFPVGGVAVSRYRPTTVSSVSATDTWDVSYVGKNPTSDGYSNFAFNSANMAKVSQYEYWLVSNSSGTTAAGLTLSYGTGSYGTPDIGNVASLKTARWNGTQWDVPPGGGTFSQTGDSFTGTVSVSFQSAFSPQTLASTDPASALPVELLYFKGEAVQSGVQLSWKTTTELNNDYFTVLHSADGEKFSEIGKVKGQGTTTVAHSYGLLDASPVLGKNYYKLVQTDYDGKTTSFKTIVVDVENIDPINVKVYPNPVDHSQTLSVEVTGVNPNQSIDFQLVNMQGIVLHNRTIQSDSNGMVNAEYTPTEIAAGLYILRIGGASTKVVIR